MPNLLIYGIPSRISRVKLEAFERELKTGVAAIKALELTPLSVTPRFIAELLDHREPDLCVIVDGLFVNPKRTDEVRKRLCEHITDMMVMFADREIPQWRSIEVYTRSHGQAKEVFISVTPSRT